MHPSVHPLVCWSVNLLVDQYKSKSGKMSVFLLFFVYVCVHVGYWGVDGGWTPLPTRPQRYCDPASLVPSALTAIHVSTIPVPERNS